MDPFTLAFLGTTAISTVLGAAGKIQSGDAQATQDLQLADQSDTQAQIAGLQGNIAGINAQTDQSNVGLLKTQAAIAQGGVSLAYDAGRVQEGRIIAQGRQTLATQRNYFAGNNLDASFGSPLLVQAMTASRVASDVDLTRASTEIAASQAKTNAANIEGQAAGAAGRVVSDIGTQISSVLSADSDTARAASLRAKAGSDQAAGYLGAATTVAAGVSSAFGKVGGGGGSSAPGGSFNVGDQTFPMYT